MTNFILDKIQLRNVRCYGDEMMEMDFPLNNLTVFTGRVGAGKSTIFKAVSIALYGDDGGAKNEKLTIDDMLNEKNQKNLEIHLYFHSTVDDANQRTEYEIHLYHKHKKYSNKLVFMKDGRDISLESKTATYELIERTLIPKNVYHNVYYFTQQCKNFFTALPNSEQKEIFNAILDLSEYKCYYENVKEKIGQFQLEQRGYDVGNEANKQNLEVLIQNHQRSVESLKSLKEQNSQEVQKMTQAIQNLKTKIDGIKNSTRTVDDVNEEIGKLQLEFNNIQNEFNSSVSKIDIEIKNLTGGFETKIEELKAKACQIRAEKTNGINSDIAEQEKLLEKRQTEHAVNVSKIEQDKQDTIIKITSEYQGKIDVKRADIDSIKDEIRKTQTERDNEISSLNEKYIQAKSKLDGDVTVCNHVIGEGDYITKIDVQINKLQVEIDQYKSDLEKEDSVCRVCGNKITDKEHILKHIKTIEGKKSELVSDKSERVKNVEDAKKKLEVIQTKLGNLKDKFDENVSNVETSYNSKISELDACVCEIEETVKNLIEERTTECDSISHEADEMISKLKESLEEDSKGIRDRILELNNRKNAIDNVIREKYKVRYAEEKTSVDKKISDHKSEKEKLQNGFLVQKEKYESQKNTLDSALQAAVNSKQEIESGEREILRLQTQIDELGRKDYYDVFETDIEDKVRSIEKQKELISDTEQKLKDATRKLNILEFWKTAFSDSGIKSMLIDSAIPHMNECVANELEKVAPGMFTVSFDTLSETKSGNVRDKFCIHIVNNMKGSTGHKKLSGGEKRIIDLCCMAALRSLAERLYNKRFCHIFYDEILDSLDDSCKAQFCANAKLQSSNGCNVTLITHDMPEDVDPDRTFPF